jgi:hypothetical protein
LEAYNLFRRCEDRELGESAMALLQSEIENQTCIILLLSIQVAGQKKHVGKVYTFPTVNKTVEPPFVCLPLKPPTCIFRRMMHSVFITGRNTIIRD